MRPEMPLTFFRCPNRKGEALAVEVKRLGERLGYRIHVPPEATQEDFALACLRETAVVVDASVEPGCERVYSILTEYPKSLDHVLVVSRTYLPLNFFGMVPGGAPRYPYPLPDPGREAPDIEWGNEQIPAWLEARLHDIAERPRGLRLNVRSAAELQGREEVIGQMMVESSERRKAGRAGKVRIFLSYRGNHFDAVQSLARRIRGGEWHPGSEPEVVLLAPGILCYDRELLSEVRRWQVFAQLDDMLRESDELWIYRTPDYLDSWWTVGELVAAAYIAGDGKPGPRVRVLDPTSGTLSGPLAEYEVTLAAEHRRRIARLFSNTRLDAMGPENLWVLRLMRRLYNLGLGGFISRRLARTATESGVVETMLRATPAPEEERSALAEEIATMWADPAATRAYLNDPVFSREFWENLSAERGQRSLGPDGRINPERFITYTERLRRAVPPARAARAARRGRPLRMGDGTRVRVEARAPRLLWHPARMGGAISGKLETLPTFVAVDAD